MNHTLFFPLHIKIIIGHAPNSAQREQARNFPLDVRRALTNCSRNEATLQGIPDLILLQSLTHDPLPPQGATLPSDSDSYSSSSSYASSSSDNSADGAGREASPSLSYRGGGGGDSDGIRKGRKRTKYGVRRRRRKRRRRSSRRCSDPDFLDVVDAEPVDAPAPKPKRRPARRRTRKSVGGGSRRRRTSPAERAMLEKLFKINPWPRSELLNLYAGRLGWTRRSVQIWFQNQRRGFRKAFNDGKITMVNPGNAQFRRSLLPPSLSAVIPAVPDNPVDDGSGDGDGAGAGGVVGAAGAVERDAPPAADTAQDGTGDGGDGATHDEALAAGASDAPSKGGPTDPAAVGDAGDVADAGDVGGDAKDGTDSKKRGRGSQTYVLLLLALFVSFAPFLYSACAPPPTRLFTLFPDTNAPKCPHPRD